MAKKRSGWDIQSQKKGKDSFQFRDVYEDQQFERTKRGEKQSPTSRIVAAVLAGIGVTFITYFILSLVFFGVGAIKNLIGGATAGLGLSPPAYVESANGSYDDGSVGSLEGSQGSLEYEEGSMGSVDANASVEAGESSVGTYDVTDIPGDEIPYATLEEFYREHGIFWVPSGYFIEYPYTSEYIDGEGFVFYDDETGEKMSEPRRDKVDALFLRNLRIEYLGEAYADVDTDSAFQRAKEGVFPSVSGTAPEVTGEGATGPDGEVITDGSLENGSVNGDGSAIAGLDGIITALKTPTLPKVLLSLLAGLLTFLIVYSKLMRNLAAQNAMNDTADINEHQGDVNIMVPEEVMQTFDFFPDVGMHSSVQVSSMISHVALTNKGIKKVKLTRRYDKDVLDEDGDVLYAKGEAMYDDDGELVQDTVPLFDTEFMEDLFTASTLPKDKALRKYYNPTEIPYNPGGENRDKLKYDTLADLINDDWILPDYEPQRPGGAYIVDTAPVNTMVLAITRAGKGQTVIEPTMDMWMRERNPHNFIANDPKGELLVKNYVPATVRGFQVIQFNLINALKTDIYNPLGLAGDAAREGNFAKCAQYIGNVADVFFPVDGGDDPVWPNAR